jgi:hypothetical protein
VQFAREESAQAAVGTLTGAVIQGKPIDVRPSARKTRLTLFARFA